MNIVPKPQKSVKLGGEFTVTAETKVYCDEEFALQAQRFIALVEECCSFKLEMTDDISLAHIIFTLTDKCSGEEYFVMIAEGLTTVSAAQEVGCFYAVETLRQVFSLDTPQEVLTCNNCYIQDGPKFVHRGLSVDICRHFFPLSTLKQIVELMARVKLNRLHLHLADDQGFRLEIEKYPLLNQISSTRVGSEVVENGARVVDDVPVSGYLTKAEVNELVAFAGAHQVEIIPEIDIPGHAVAMLAAYPQYSCVGADLEVRKKWGISKDILCAGNEEMYTFVEDILDEVCALFPCEYIHLGGDEAPKDRWCNCHKCRAKLAELKLDNFDQLQTYMVEVFRKHLEAKGKKVICWNDGVEKNSSMQIVSQLWKPMTRSSGIRQANSGRKTIMSPFFHLYFDYPYAMTPLKKTFKFNALRGIKKSSRNNVLGVEGALWTEYIATEDKLFFNLLPRMLALAECAWGNNKGDFLKRANNYLAVYEKLGLTYNHQAIKKASARNLRTVKKFFKYNSNIELDEQNKKIQKLTEKQQ